jgi:poly(hydroxyalkanoate) depolymerase family esterase
MLHGCTQSPDDFAAGTRMNFHAEKQNCFVVYLEQPSGANQAKCWNWFRTGDQRRGGGEPSLIAGITRQIMRDHAIDPKRAYVAGLSAGGAAAAIMGATYPDLYAAVGIHSGLACGAASDPPSPLVAMRQGGGSKAIADGKPSVPTIVFPGDRDSTVHPNNGDRIIEQTAAAASPTTKVLRGSSAGPTLRSTAGSPYRASSCFRRAAQTSSAPTARSTAGAPSPLTRARPRTARCRHDHSACGSIMSRAGCCRRP